jgi:hypothetical protein
MELFRLLCALKHTCELLGLPLRKKPIGRESWLTYCSLGTLKIRASFELAGVAGWGR